MPTSVADVTSSLNTSQHLAMTPKEAFERTRAREEALSRLLMAFITSGLIFMVFPGTFLGVWNLLQISGRESVASISQAWLQAHGHAQVFGWVGSFILGIGFYSIPKLRGTAKSTFSATWVCWVMWTVGVAMRWTANVYGWEWRVLLPVSALLELAAFLIFFRAVSQHRPADSGKPRMEPWIWIVISASTGLLVVLVANLAGCIYVSLRGATPAFPHVFDQRYLTLMAWGFLVPFVWGFSAKWMSVFLGLRPLRTNLLLAAVIMNLSGVALTIVGVGRVGSWLFVAGVALAIVGSRTFEPGVREAKIRGVHSSFPIFVRMAYAWLLVAATLGVSAVLWDSSGGIWGASRHALTVGFVAVMIMSVGHRVLPAFAGMRLLWSTKLMFAGLALVTVGCTLRVSSEVIAYQGYAAWAWSVLPISALFELAGLTAFAINILGTFALEPSHAQTQPVIVGKTELRTGESPH
ncbi:MAG TPA: hypothetical protein VEX69_08075 [Candidatus Limnocylindria bacterium]|nr:hypothetical protein [Candidatus Limnocylindria bacterium]